MSSGADFLESDAAYARQLQEEEAFGLQMNGFGQRKSDGTSSGSSANQNSRRSGNSIDDISLSEAGPHHIRVRGNSNEYAPASAGAAAAVPLLAHAGGNRQARDVQNHALEEAQSLQDTSPTILGIFLTLGIIELIMAIVVLSKGWDQYCDRPLRTFILIYCSRWLFYIPLSIKRYQRRHIQYNPQRPDVLFRYQTWITFLSLIVMIIGQYFFFTSHCENSSPWLYKFTLALIVMFYIGFFLPIILRFVMCLCLPCALIFIRIFQVEPGAKPEVINSLPKRKWHAAVPSPSAADAAARAESAPDGGAPSPAAAAAPDETPSCAICMEDYVEGVEVRDLPNCSHYFHVPCVDRWLQVNATCPLCRQPIAENSNNNNNNNNNRNANRNDAANDIV